MLNLLLIQLLLRVYSAHHLSLYIGNSLGYLLILLLEKRVGILLLLTLYSTSKSLSRMPRIISSVPKSIRSATLISTTDCRNIRWDKKCCSLRKHFTWLVLGSSGLGLLDLLGFWSVLGRLPTDWILGGDLNMSIMSSTSPSFASTLLEDHMQTHLSQSR